VALRLTQAGDYGVRAMIHIGSLPESRLASKEAIALAEAIPPSFMAKVLRRLVRGGLLRSSRGARGGFSLARDTSEITLLDILAAIEGPIQLTDCSGGAHGCAVSHECPASAVWPEVQQQMAMLLRETTLEALLSAPRRVRRAVGAAGR
jgi:Rrf2 family protein